MNILKRITAIITCLILLITPSLFHSKYLEDEAEALAENIIEFEVERHCGITEIQTAEIIKCIEG